MSWSGGVYSRGYPSWSADAASNLPISATKFDLEDNDFAGGLNNCITKDGLSVPNSALTWSLAGQILQLNRTNDGTVFGAGRTAGSNNPNLQINVTDSVGVTFNLTTPQKIQFATQTTVWGSVNSTGNWVLNGATSGATLTITAGGITITAGGLAVTAGGISVAATTGAVSLIVTGAANQLAQEIFGQTTSGQSFGLLIEAGTTSSDYGLRVRNAANTSDFLRINGDGSGTLGPSASLGLSWNAAGNMSIAVASSGSGLTLNQGGSSSATLVVTNGSQSGQFGLGFAFSAGEVELAAIGAVALAIGCTGAGIFSVWTNSNQRLTVAATGAFVVNPPTSGTAASITGIAGSNALLVQSSLTASSAFGVNINGGTNATDYSLLINDANNTINIFKVQAVPGISGRGPVAAALVDMTPDKGSFVGTLTGCTTAPTLTFNWSRQGNTVTIYCTTSLVATSNSTGCQITGVPAALNPANSQTVSAAMQNNGANVLGCVNVGTSGQLILGGGAGVTGNFTASGSKGIPGIGLIITYSLV